MIGFVILKENILYIYHYEVGEPKVLSAAKYFDQKSPILSHPS